MVRLLALLALAGCYDDLYKCATDAQCDVEGGRCELDGFCTGYDELCPTNRRYQEHAGAKSNTCYEDNAIPLNACAGGQVPATREGCFAAVCDRLPLCCDIAWTDACAQLAQQECDIRCDTRIAIGATRQMVTELWDVRWVGDHFTVEPVTELFSPLHWVAPAPGSVEPRLAGVVDTKLVIGTDHEFEIDPLRIYQNISTIPFARDGHETFAAASQLGAEFSLEIFEPAIEEHRTFDVPGAAALSWSDIDHRDAYPDAVLRKDGANSGEYAYVLNLEGDDHLRQLVDKTVVRMAGGATQGGIAVRSTDWLDLDGDQRADLATFGSQVLLHHNDQGLRETPEEVIDCLPPALGGCAALDEPDFESASFAGAALPDPVRPSVVFATFPDRKLFRASLDNDVEIEQIPFPGDDCSCERTCKKAGCTGQNCACEPDDCVCTYDCTTCLPIVAVIVRDLDGDHQLDLIAIDARMNLYSALAPGFAWSEPTSIPTALLGNRAQLATSVTGAPL